MDDEAVAILGRVQRVFREYFDDGDLVVRRETTAKEVEEWDSLATVELMIELEGEFDVRFRTGEVAVAALKDVGALVDRIAERRSSAS